MYCLIFFTLRERIKLALRMHTKKYVPYCLIPTKFVWLLFGFACWAIGIWCIPADLLMLSSAQSSLRTAERGRVAAKQKQVEKVYGVQAP